ncbi:MAG: aminoglycoside phosphotransferase family protein [Anaerolineales bacterium]|nr:aminoglycoside phosphotransferase family protein [Anaerolineales bacterium]
MLEKPNLPDEKIINCLQSEFGLSISELEFLPLGADPNTAVYRAITKNGISYFVKLRMGNFEETAVTLPKFLYEQSIGNIIPPLETQTGQLWGNIGDFKLILYQFIDGRNGFEMNFSAHHWHKFGATLKKLHIAEIPPLIKNRIKVETYSPKWRDRVKEYMGIIETKSFVDSVAIDLSAFLKLKRDEIFDLLERTERLALKLGADSPPFTVCHSDVHAGNILIDENDRFYIVDWDNPILAPKERDLMFVGGGQGFRGHTAQEEEILFYEGYGEAEINRFVLTYYRYERIVEDIAVYCDELLSTPKGGEDRAQSLEYLKSNFLPKGTIQVAYQADKTGLFS